MPLRAPGEGKVRYRYKKGTNVRLAMTGKGRVLEAKNMKTGATHSQGEFEANRRASRRSQGRGGGRR
jgi:hypothetical protein